MRVWKRVYKESIMVELTEKEEATFSSLARSAPSSLLLSGIRPNWTGEALWLGHEKFLTTKKRLAWLASHVAESYEGYKPLWLNA